jgi:hypothetical protein
VREFNAKPSIEQGKPDQLEAARGVSRGNPGQCQWRDLAQITFKNNPESVVL